MLENNYGLEELGIINTGDIYRNLSVPKLVEEALKRKEGMLASNGAFCVVTGKYTGRSPKDRFIVNAPGVRNEIAWGKVNHPISIEKFTYLYNRLIAYLQKRDLFIFDGYAGSDPEYRINLRVITEYAHHNLFMHQLLIRPSLKELVYFQPEYTLLCAPGFNCLPEIDGVNSETAIVIDFKSKLIIITGTHYCGEMKKAIFSLMNYVLPRKNVLPMHCSANVGKNSDVALFFGLSGTGKTTLSADPNRHLIGDDEHGWSEQGVFNIEGGCYAKTINLSQKKEPQIWDAIKFGSLLENVKINPITRALDYSDDMFTENTRAAYPIDHIPDAVLSGTGGIPKTVIFLTADAFGVLPPISKLTKEQAMYHFLSGYTSKLAGTERGITEPRATFSACFGEPFLPLNPIEYANMLGEKIEKYNVNVFLVNTGWVGGPYGVGHRINLKKTRAMVEAALNGELNNVEYYPHPIFKIAIPKSCPNVADSVLNPINMWDDKPAYEKQAKKLALEFAKNFADFTHSPEEVKKAGPNLE